MFLIQIKHWVPVFDQHNFNVVFQNHDHAYLRSKPLTNNKVSNNGVIYTGNGAWGVNVNYNSPGPDFYKEVVRRRK